MGNENVKLPVYSWDEMDEGKAQALQAAANLQFTFHGYRDCSLESGPSAFASFDGSYCEVPVEPSGGGRCIVPLDEHGRPCDRELTAAHRYLMMKMKIEAALSALVSHMH